MSADEGRHARVVVVDIEKAGEDGKKPFLGGFRHKKTALVYHHAVMQTVSTQQAPPPVPKYERAVQTQILETRSQQTCRETGTQMNRPGIWVDDSRYFLLFFQHEVFCKMRVCTSARIACGGRISK
jgi:hypothetical protein